MRRSERDEAVGGSCRGHGAYCACTPSCQTRTAAERRDTYIDGEEGDNDDQRRQNRYGDDSDDRGYEPSEEPAIINAGSTNRAGYAAV